MSLTKRTGLLVIAVLFLCGCQEIPEHNSNPVDTPVAKKIPVNRPLYIGHTLI